MPSGWPKGRPLSEDHRGKLLAGGMRGLRQKKRRVASMASGQMLDTTPAMWLSAKQHIGDSQYIEDGVDEVLLRALHERVVYGGSCCHREPCFQDVTLAVIARAEMEFRK